MPAIASKEIGREVNLYNPFDGRKFLKAIAIKEPGSLDALGIFHVMHFWRPIEIMDALKNINTMLKVGGVLTMTLSDCTTIFSSEYRKHADEKPWIGSCFATPLLSESFKYIEGASKGEIVTDLPCGALMELLTAYGFEIEHAKSYADFYPQNLSNERIDFIEYIGARAKKVREPNPELLTKWQTHAEICKIIEDTKHSHILYDGSMDATVDAHEKFKKDQKLLNKDRRMKLWNSIKQPG